MAHERPEYQYSLTLTSQFPYCGLPLRLDTYSKCQFSCRYCFASARGGNKGAGAIGVANSGAFERRLERVAYGEIGSVVDEFLEKKLPIHLGGMSDPFPPLEKKSKITAAHLAAARAFRQPVILSTKSNLVSRDDNLTLLAGGPFAIQISLSTMDDEFGAQVDKGAAKPSERLRTMRLLRQAGVPVSCRIQPVFPGRESDVHELIDACADAGVSHVGVEHLKVPVETHWQNRSALNSALGFDVTRYFRDRHAKRVGREWILPIEDRLPAMISYRRRARSRNLSFGAADNDLLHLSDGQVCCSGADLLGLGPGFNYNYLEAIRRRDSNLRISYSSLSETWSPRKSIARYVNSTSRIQGATLDEYIRANWNGARHGTSPDAFYGVSRCDLVDSDGHQIYLLSREVEELIND
jgi:DNA repair photolyase